MCFFKKKKEIPQINASALYFALGEKENVSSISLNGSRLSVELKDKNKLDKEALKSLGIKNIIEMQAKTILVVEKDKTKDIEKIID